MLHGLVPAVAVAVHRVGPCGKARYFILTDKSSHSCVVASCLGKVQAACCLQLVAGVAEGLQLVSRGGVEGLAVFVEGVALPDLALLVSEQHGAAQVVLEVVAVLACLFHGGHVGVPVEGLFFPCGGVFCQQEVVVWSGQVQGVADMLFRVLEGFAVYGRDGVSGLSGVYVLADAVSKGVVGVRKNPVVFTIL